MLRQDLRHAFRVLAASPTLTVPVVLVLATASFMVGIMSGHLPMGAAISLFMVPVLAAAAIYILRGVAKRGSDV